MNSQTVKRQAASFVHAFRYVHRPNYLARRVSYKVYELTHPGEPWIAQGAVQFLNGALKKTDIAFEWGSGRSTKWYAERVKHIVSIEYDRHWHARVSAVLASQSNAECRFIELNHPRTAPTFPHYNSIPTYVAAIDECGEGSLDFVVVDGHYRQACILRALPKLKHGALLLVDNTNWMPLEDWGVPSNWPIVHQSANVMTQTTIWRKP